MNNITVKKIVLEYLAKHECDGLCNDDCGCGIDNLAPCDGNAFDCVPAKKVKQHCNICRHINYCDSADEGKSCYRPAEIKDQEPLNKAMDKLYSEKLNAD